jgi:DNA polymerase-3 subunit alpha
MFTYLGETGDLGELDDLGITGDNLPPIPEFSPKEKLALEKEMVGLYISGHPLDQYRLILENLRGVVPLAELGELGERREVSIAGMISSVRAIYTKKGRPMSFLKVEDFTGEVEVVVFSDIHERCQSDLQEDRVVLIKGSTDFKEEEEVKIISKEITFFPAEAMQLMIRIHKDISIGEMLALKKILTSFSGSIPVYLYFEKNGKMLLTGQEFWVNDAEDELFRSIENLFGSDCLKIQQLASR